MAVENVKRGGKPFGAVIVKDDRVIATGTNKAAQTGDLTSHAETEAIRKAGIEEKSDQLKGATLYASGHPCPMCLAALVMAGAEQVFFAFDNADAQPYGLSSEGAYQRLRMPLQPPPLPLTRLDTGITAAQLYGNAPWA